MSLFSTRYTGHWQAVNSTDYLIPRTVDPASEAETLVDQGLAISCAVSGKLPRCWEASGVELTGLEPMAYNSQKHNRRAPTLAVRVGASFNQWLEGEAARRGISRSDLVRVALEVAFPEAPNPGAVQSST